MVYTLHSAKHAIAAERDRRPLTSEQRKAWSQNMGHENEKITDMHYAKLTDESCLQVLEEIPEKAASQNLLSLTDEEKLALFDGIAKIADRR